VQARHAGRRPWAGGTGSHTMMYGSQRQFVYWACCSGDRQRRRAARGTDGVYAPRLTPCVSPVPQRALHVCRRELKESAEIMRTANSPGTPHMWTVAAQLILSPGGPWVVKTGGSSVVNAGVAFPEGAPGYSASAPLHGPLRAVCFAGQQKAHATKPMSHQASAHVPRHWSCTQPQARCPTLLAARYNDRDMPVPAKGKR
jgi:hypothetical protein